MAWIEPVTNRVAGSRTTYEDLNRICNNLLEKGFILTKSEYDYGDIVTAGEWAEIVNAAKRGDSTVTDSTLYSNLNKLEAAIINAEPEFPLNFKALESTNIAFTPTGTGTLVAPIQYKINNGNWTDYTMGDSISLAVDDKCYFQGNSPFFSIPANIIKFSSTGYVSANGNIMSLLDNTLQSTTIYMDSCFKSLFENCRNLVSAPQLPATTLRDECYRNMFSGCSSLVTVPKLPATSLETLCYRDMFNGCTSLKVYTSSGEGHDKAWRIPTSGTGEGSSAAMRGMFERTIGGLEDGALNTTYYTQNEPV